MPKGISAKIKKVKPKKLDPAMAAQNEAMHDIIKTFTQMDPNGNDYSNMEIIHGKWDEVITLYSRYINKLKAIKDICFKSSVVVEGLEDYINRCTGFFEPTFGWYDSETFKDVDFRVVTKDTTLIRSIYLKLRSHKFNAEAMRILRTLIAFEFRNDISYNEFVDLCKIKDHTLFFLNEITVDRTTMIPRGFTGVNDITSLWAFDSKYIKSEKQKKNVFKAIRVLYNTLHEINELFSKPDFDVKALFAGLMKSLESIKKVRGVERGYNLLKNYAGLFEENFNDYFKGMIKEGPGKLFTMFVSDVKDDLLGTNKEDTTDGKSNVSREDIMGVSKLLIHLKKELKCAPGIKNNDKLMKAIDPVLSMLTPILEHGTADSSHNLTDEELEKQSKEMMELLQQSISDMSTATDL
jgi:hypothetical protein